MFADLSRLKVTCHSSDVRVAKVNNKGTLTKSRGVATIGVIVDGVFGSTRIAGRQK